MQVVLSMDPRASADDTSSSAISLAFMVLAALLAQNPATSLLESTSHMPSEAMTRYL
jgi:hypothetical protein